MPQASPPFIQTPTASPLLGGKKANGLCHHQQRHAHMHPPHRRLYKCLKLLLHHLFKHPLLPLVAKKSQWSLSPSTATHSHAPPHRRLYKCRKRPPPFIQTPPTSPLVAKKSQWSLSPSTSTRSHAPSAPTAVQMPQASAACVRSSCN